MPPKDILGELVQPIALINVYSSLKLTFDILIGKEEDVNLLSAYDVVGIVLLC